LADALIAARVVHLTATVLVVGAVIFQFCIAAPALERELADARALARFTRVTAWSSLAVAIASGAVWLVLLSAQIAGGSIGEALSGDAFTVLTQTQFCRALAIRFAIAGLLATVLFGHESWNGFRWLAVALVICFAGVLAWMGHSGAGDGIAGDAQVAADALHIISAATWVGCLVPLVYLFTLAAVATSVLSSAEVASATRRFSNLGIVSVATVLISGLINAWFQVGSLAILLDSTYGRLLMIKAALFLVMLGIAAANRIFLTPKITAASREARMHPLRQLAGNSLLEAILGFAITLIVGILGMLAPELPTMEHIHLHSD
jgi:putative copper resistance protein D